MKGKIEQTKPSSKHLTCSYNLHSYNSFPKNKREKTRRIYVVKKNKIKKNKKKKEKKQKKNGNKKEIPVDYSSLLINPGPLELCFFSQRSLSL